MDTRILRNCLGDGRIKGDEGDLTWVVNIYFKVLMIIIELYTQNCQNFINQYHTNKFNKKLGTSPSWLGSVD